MQTRISVQAATALTLLAVAVSGCGNRPSPLPSIEAAKLAVSEATRNEANQYAPSELRKAQDKLAQAEVELKKKNDLEARRMSEQATVDARYAQVRAQAEKEQSAAIENIDTTQTIQGVR